MNVLKCTLAFWLLVAATVSAAQSSIYRCPSPSGGKTLSDRPCANGEVRDGNSWISVEDLNRRKAEEAALAKKALEDRARMEKQAADARARELDERIAKRVAIEEARQGVSSRPTPEAIDKMTTYAVVLGRAIGCGLNVQSEAARVGGWFDLEFPAGSAKSTYAIILANGMKENAERQRSGKSPDSCQTVRSQMQGFPWP